MFLLPDFMPPPTQPPPLPHNSQEFDSNAKSDKSFKFKVGKGKVIKVVTAVWCRLTCGQCHDSEKSLDGKWKHSTMSNVKA